MVVILKWPVECHSGKTTSGLSLQKLPRSYNTVRSAQLLGPLTPSTSHVCTCNPLQPYTETSNLHNTDKHLYGTDTHTLKVLCTIQIYSYHFNAVPSVGTTATSSNAATSSSVMTGSPLQTLQTVLIQAAINHCIIGTHNGGPHLLHMSGSAA